MADDSFLGSLYSYMLGHVHSMMGISPSQGHTDVQSTLPAEQRGMDRNKVYDPNTGKPALEGRDKSLEELIKMEKGIGAPQAPMPNPAPPAGSSLAPTGMQPATPGLGMNKTLYQPYASNRQRQLDEQMKTAEGL